MSDLYAQYQSVRAQESQTKFNWRERAFDKQRTLIEDPAKLKASFTTRRGAKSYADGIYLYKEAFETPKCNCLYLGLTRLSAKGIIWKDVLKDIDERDNLNSKFHETELTVTTPNKSVIYVAGVDVDEAERKKLFGRKYKLVVIDEAALYSIDLYDLVYVTLKPAMTDMRGTIVLSGMASDIVVGLFYDITTGKEKGWSLHTWSAHDNPHVAKQWQEELDEIKRLRPHFMDTPKFKQAYLNKWVVDDDVKVYKYNEERNSASGLPVFDTPWNYVLGCDLGHSPDPTTFVVEAYHPLSRELHIVHAEKHLGMDVTAVAEREKQLSKTWDFEAKVIDGANKMAVEELNTRHKCNFIPADKIGKQDFINLMNADFQASEIKLHPKAQELADQYKILVWECESGKVKLSPTGQRREHPTIPNDLCDAALYAWRYTYTYLYKKPELVVPYSSQERWEPEHIKKLESQVEAERNPTVPELGIDPNDVFGFDLMDDSQFL